MSRALLVALHGVGSTGHDLAAALAPLAPVAEVVALDGGEPFDGGGHARQWFSVAGITDIDRPLRVAGALPPLLRRLDRIAAERGSARDQLVLLGFSQGAIMTLAAVASGRHAGRAIAVAGRLAGPVAPHDHEVHLASGDVLLVHDHDDRVMDPALSTDAAARLRLAGRRAAVETTTGVGHALGPATLTAIVDWLWRTADPLSIPLSCEG